MKAASVKFGTFLTHRKEFTQIDDFETYRRARVQLHWKGIVLRDKVQGAEIKTKDQQVARAGELLVAEIDAKVGGVGIVPNELDGAIVSSHYFLFQIDETKCLCSWLDCFILSGALEDQLQARGSTNYAAIRPHHVLQCELPLPPLDEQRRIVARIEELAAKIDEARLLRRQTIEESKALVAAEISRVFSEGPKRGWKEGQLGDYVIDDCYGTSEKTSTDSTGTPILRMGNIQNGRLYMEDLKYLHISERDRDKLILQRGDILVNRTNSAELVGKCAVFDLNGEYGFASYLIKLRLDRQRAEPRLVAAYINSPAGRRYMFRERKQMTGQANVNAKKLKALPLSLPEPPEQHRIIAYVDSFQAKVEYLKTHQQETAKELNALMPSLLSKAFSGEI